MSFGITISNDNNFVQIDSDTPRLCAIHNGNYSAGSNVSVVTFPSPITTPEPPCIFIRNDPSRNDDLYDALTISGGPGNWTGFQIRANNVNMRPTGKWFAAVFASVAQSSYGLRIWDGGGGIVYDSGAAPVVVTKSNSSWTFMGVVQFPTLGSAYYYANALVAPLATDEYFMINPFARGAVNVTGAYHRRGVRFNYSTNRLEMYIVAFPQNPPQNDQGNPAALYARLPGS